MAEAPRGRAEVRARSELENGDLADARYFARELARTLQKQTGLSRGRSTNVRLTLRALEQDQNLVAYFKSFVTSKYDRPTADGTAAA